MTSHSIRINSVNLFVELKGKPLTGEHPTLVLVHGYLSSLFSFRDLIPFLEPHFSLVLLDLPGFGKSEKSKRFEHSLDNFAQTLLDLLTYFNLEKVTVVGHSMGGQIGLRAARMDPNRIEKVVGMSAAGYMGPVKRSLRMATKLPFFPLILGVYFKRHDVKKTFRDVTYNPSIVTEEMMQGYLEPFKEKAFFHSLTRLVQDREGDLTTSELKEIEQPVMLLWGKEDQIVPLSIGKRLNEDLTHSSLKVYDETGHLLPEERPKEVAEEIITFVLERLK